MGISGPGYYIVLGNRVKGKKISVKQGGEPVEIEVSFGKNKSTII